MHKEMEMVFGQGHGKEMCGTYCSLAILRRFIKSDSASSPDPVYSCSSDVSADLSFDPTHSRLRALVGIDFLMQSGELWRSCERYFQRKEAREPNRKPVVTALELD
ncbi:hypothetical protein WMY93_031470 [Mugilogobius chulae]|uniref:Uncharacterized protein n=1 Tax=Mugilogobius chulae TaxID=88201 RepID=A0AAW0MID6_9GOBI